jgi:HEAT repeat protein
LRHSSLTIQIALACVTFATVALVAEAREGAHASTQSPASSPPPASQSGAESKHVTISRYAATVQTGDEEERRQAVVMLGAMRDPATIDVLRAALDDKSERVRAAAIAALGWLREPALAPLIATYVTKDKHAFVRKTAVYALGQCASGEVTAALAAALRDKDLEVRGAAAVSLSNRPDAAAIEPLIAALTDKSAFVRAHAAVALGVNGRAAARAVPGLVKVLTTDEDHEARRQAATALGHIGEPSALPALEQAEHSSDPYLSQAAREAISQIRRQ